MHRLMKNIKILIGVSIVLSFCITLFLSKKMFISELGMYKQHDRNIWSDMVCTQEISLCKTQNIGIFVYPQKNENIDSSIGVKVRILSEHYDHEEFFSLSDLLSDQWNLLTIHDENMKKVNEYATVYIESIGMTEENYIMLNLGEDLSTVNYETYIMGENQENDNISLRYDRFSYVSFLGMELLFASVIFFVFYKLKNKMN